jgi:hypothetical protein
MCVHASVEEGCPLGDGLLDEAPRLDHHLHPEYSGRMVLVQCQDDVNTVLLDPAPRLTTTFTRSTVSEWCQVLKKGGGVLIVMGLRRRGARVKGKMDDKPHNPRPDEREDAQKE